MGDVGSGVQENTQVCDLHISHLISRIGCLFVPFVLFVVEGNSSVVILIA
jgi:hypothetical protein